MKIITGILILNALHLCFSKSIEDTILREENVLGGYNDDPYALDLSDLDIDKLIRNSNDDELLAIFHSITKVIVSDISIKSLQTLCEYNILVEIESEDNTVDCTNTRRNRLVKRDTTDDEDEVEGSGETDNEDQDSSSNITSESEIESVDSSGDSELIDNSPVDNKEYDQVDQAQATLTEGEADKTQANANEETDISNTDETSKHENDTDVAPSQNEVDPSQVTVVTAVTVPAEIAANPLEDTPSEIAVPVVQTGEEIPIQETTIPAITGPAEIAINPPDDTVSEVAAEVPPEETPSEVATEVPPEKTQSEVAAEVPPEETPSEVAAEVPPEETPSKVDEDVPPKDTPSETVDEIAQATPDETPSEVPQVPPEETLSEIPQPSDDVVPTHVEGDEAVVTEVVSPTAEGTNIGNESNEQTDKEAAREEIPPTESDKIPAPISTDQDAIPDETKKAEGDVPRILLRGPDAIPLPVPIPPIQDEEKTTTIETTSENEVTEQPISKGDSPPRKLGDSVDGPVKNDRNSPGVINPDSNIGKVEDPKKKENLQTGNERKTMNPADQDQQSVSKSGISGLNVFIFFVIAIAIGGAVIFGYKMYKRKQVTYRTVNTGEDFGKELQEVKVKRIDDDVSDTNDQKTKEAKPLMFNDLDITEIEDQQPPTPTPTPRTFKVTPTPNEQNNIQENDAKGEDNNTKKN